MQITLYNIKSKPGLNSYNRLSLLKEAFKFETYGEANEFSKKLEDVYEYKTTEQDAQKIALSFDFQVREDKNEHDYWSKENVDKRQAEYNEANAWYESLPQKEKKYVNVLARVTAGGAFA